MTIDTHNLEHFFPKLRDIAVTYGLDELSLFGSVLRDSFKDDSDVDVLISFTKNIEQSLERYAELHQALSNLFGREVHLTELELLENPIRRRVILKTRRVVHAMN